MDSTLPSGLVMWRPRADTAATRPAPSKPRHPVGPVLVTDCAVAAGGSTLFHALWRAAEAEARADSDKDG